MNTRPGAITRLRAHWMAKMVAFVAPPIVLAGCYRSVPWSVPAPVLSDPLVFDHRGDRWTLLHPAVEGDTVLTGWQRSGTPATGLVVSAQHPREEYLVDSVLVRLPLRGADQVFDGRKTAIRLSLTVLSIGAFIGLMAWGLSDSDFGVEIPPVVFAR